MSRRISARERAMAAYQESLARAQEFAGQNMFTRGFDTQGQLQALQDVNAAQFWQQQGLQQEAQQAQLPQQIGSAIEQAKLMGADKISQNPSVGENIGRGYALGQALQGGANATDVAQMMATNPKFSTQAQNAAQLRQTQMETNMAQAQANLERTKMDLEMLRSGQLPPLERAKVEEQMRDNFRTDFGESEEVLVGYQVLEAALSQARNNPSATFAAVVKFAKILDPGSVVRTEEGRAVTDSSDGLIQGLVNQLNKARGSGWEESTVKNLRDVAQAITVPYANQATAIVDQYDKTAAGYGIDPATLYMGQSAPLEAVRKSLGMTVDAADLGLN